MKIHIGSLAVGLGLFATLHQAAAQGTSFIYAAGAVSGGQKGKGGFLTFPRFSCSKE